MKITRIIRFVIYFLIMLTFLIFMTGFITENSSDVGLVLLGYRFEIMPLSALLLIVFFAGGMIGVTSGAFIVLKSSLYSSRLERRLKRRDDELKKLRMDTLKGLS